MGWACKASETGFDMVSATKDATDLRSRKRKGHGSYIRTSVLGATTQSLYGPPEYNFLQ